MGRTGTNNGTLSKKVISLFISKEILKAEIFKIGPPCDISMDSRAGQSFVEL